MWGFLGGIVSCTFVVYNLIYVFTKPFRQGQNVTGHLSGVSLVKVKFFLLLDWLLDKG